MLCVMSLWCVFRVVVSCRVCVVCVVFFFVPIMFVRSHQVLSSCVALYCAFRVVRCGSSVECCTLCVGYVLYSVRRALCVAQCVL